MTPRTGQPPVQHLPLAELTSIERHRHRPPASRPMSAPQVPALVLFALLGIAGSAWGQETTGEPTVIAVTALPGSIFSHDELARARQVAIANQARRESYIRAGGDDDIVVLEPYIVEGDSSLLLARLRRAMERGVDSPLRPRLAVGASVMSELVLRQKQDDEFFHGPSPGAPPEHVTRGVGLVSTSGAESGFAAVIGAFRKRRMGELLRAPE